MTTTAFDDQFTVAPDELVRQPYDTVAILRRNVAALEVALRTQTERAIQAERDFESLISDDNTIQEYAYELGGTDSGEYHLTAQDVARIAAKASEPYTSAHSRPTSEQADTTRTRLMQACSRKRFVGVLA